MFTKLAIATVLVLTLTACGGTNSEPVSLSGNWETAPIEEGETLFMSAVIKNNIMTIDFNDEDGRMLYWKGTVPELVSPDETFVSEGDVEEMEFALLASTLEEKEFTYEGGQITFDWEIMGVSRTMKLSRS